jgi:hypothetical protein
MSKPTRRKPRKENLLISTAKSGKEQGIESVTASYERGCAVARQREERFKASGPDQAWSMGFVTDQRQDGTRFRANNRRCLHTRSCGDRSRAMPQRR